VFSANIFTLYPEFFPGALGQGIYQRALDKKIWNLNVKNIFSLDIADESKADYVMDFNSLPEEWKFKWDVIYSNSIDHALDATAVFYKWLNIVKEGGLIVIGFDISYENPCETDCNTFKKEKIISFFKEIHNKKIKILEHNTIACGDGTDYFHITLKKL